MEKKDITLLILLIGLLFGYQLLDPIIKKKFFPDPPASRQEQVIETTLDPAATNAVTVVAAVPAVPVAPATPVVPVLAPAPDCDAVMRKPQNVALAAAAPQNANAARRGHQGLFR